MDEPIIDYLQRRLGAFSPKVFPVIAREAGVSQSLIIRLRYRQRRNPGVRTVQPLLDYFSAIDRGEREIPSRPDQLN